MSCPPPRKTGRSACPKSTDTVRLSLCAAMLTQSAPRRRTSIWQCLNRIDDNPCSRRMTLTLHDRPCRLLRPIRCWPASPLRYVFLDPLHRRWIPVELARYRSDRLASLVSASQTAVCAIDAVRRLKSRAAGPLRRDRGRPDHWLRCPPGEYQPGLPPLSSESARDSPSRLEAIGRWQGR